MIVSHAAALRIIKKVIKDYDFEEMRKDKKLRKIQHALPKVYYYNNTRKEELDLHRPFIDDVWFEKDGVRYERISEVLDCWMESASMPY